MKLSELEKYHSITIQCHDNPDADALASGFGLYTYFRKKGKKVRLIYMGKNQIRKTNLTLMVNKLRLPIEYLGEEKLDVEGLLITVDCQYGAGNVTCIQADAVAVIDHHHAEIKPPLCEIRTKLGSCSTLVWHMMKKEGFSFEEEPELSTALYYGLFSDTNQFSEIYNPLDMDMRDSLNVDKSLITLFKNSNLSLEEMQTAGHALLENRYNGKHRYSLVKTRPCDPNVLGLISDFLLQVDKVDVCVVYNVTDAGIKFSVRSCVREVRAAELAAFLGEEVGSGGGHSEKAGGFIPWSGYEEQYSRVITEDFFDARLEEYFESSVILYADEYQTNTQDMELYRKKKLPMGFVRLMDIYDAGTEITLRTVSGDKNMTVMPDMVMLIDLEGEVYTIREETFREEYIETREHYQTPQVWDSMEYEPTIRNRVTGEVNELEAYACQCLPDSEERILVRELSGPVKIFKNREADSYQLGRAGDFLSTSCEGKEDVQVISREVFKVVYEKV